MGRTKAENSWEERLWNRGLTWDEGHSLTLLTVVPINQVIERVTERMCQLNHRTLLWFSSSYWASTHAHTHTHTHTHFPPTLLPPQPFSEAVNNKHLQPHGISHASSARHLSLAGCISEYIIGVGEGGCVRGGHDLLAPGENRPSDLSSWWCGHIQVAMALTMRAWTCTYRLK